MRLFAAIVVLVRAVTSILGQTIELGAPAHGDILYPGQNFTAQVIEPTSIEGCIQVGIALAIDNCNELDGVCPDPAVQLGWVLYAGPWTPTPHAPGPSAGGWYQNFTLQVPEYMSFGLAIFTLTHLCLLGAGPYPFLEFRNVTVTIN